MNTCVLIPSCRAFNDCWPATLACLDKFWPDCEWPIRTISDVVPWGKNPIVVPEDLGWSANLRFALERLAEEFIIMFLEDMLLVRTVNSNDLRLAHTTIKSHPEIGAIRVGQGTAPHEPVNSIMGRIHPGVMYRITTGPTLWRVSYLKEILDSVGPTAWDFENQGTAKSNALTQEIWTMYADDENNRPFRVFYSAISRIELEDQCYCHQWNPDAVKWLREEIGIQVDTSRGFMTK